MSARKQRLTRPPAVEPHESTEALPLACCNESAAVEFVEKMRWGDYPACVHCGGEDVYRMTDARTGGRNKRFLWRCRSCNRMFTARIGTVFEDSRLELRHWCYAFWRASTSGEGVAAREIMRQCRTSYKTALFVMQRLHSATLAPEPGPAPKMLKLAGSWQANIAKVLQGKRAPGDLPGWRGPVAPDGAGVISRESGRMNRAPFPDGADP
ncbi:MAG TPA: IS1595 family transposase [Gemmataceae bacterium]|nr:IS1595 family transposase [Gemmataceae bacterium]